MNAIDNTQNNTLADSLEKILPSCDRIDALVGYFYFSGFQQIYKELKDKKIRILVGMEMDESMLDRLSKIDQLDLDTIPESVNRTPSKTVAKSRYYDQFAAVFNKTDWFDNEESVQAFKVFLDKIRDGTLEIKKTSTPNHAKMYILHFADIFTQWWITPGVVISGSSNLTFNGLRGQWERNRILREPHYYEEDKTEFEKLWHGSNNIVIADKDYEVEFTTQIKKRIWLYALPDPYLVYLRVLQEYFAVEEIEDMKWPYDITNGKYSNLQYQLDAVNFGIDRIKKFGGVIIADVVWLWKSIIASAIAHNLKLKTIVIAPPHLQEQWEDYAFEFNFNAQIYSTGAIEKAWEKHWNSGEELLIILDEAHKHRNEDTDNYKYLHRLCAWNKVMALSATPFNNDPKDIYALIKLFDTPGQSTIRTVENLSFSFHSLISAYKKVRKSLRKNDSSDDREPFKKAEEIANELRRMIEPIVIRRSRLDLNEIDDYRIDLEKQGVQFAKVRSPELLEYDLGTMSGLYAETLERISGDEDGFKGARYKVSAYIKEGSKIFEKFVEEWESADDIRQRVTQWQSNLSKFMRRLLVKRFESSVRAFQFTLKKMIATTEKIRWYYVEQWFVPVFKKWELPELEELESMEDYEVDEFFESYEDKGLIRIPTSEMQDHFLAALEHDIELLNDIYSQWFSGETTPDPKLDHLLKTINESLLDDPKRKIIVFSEFSDTADYLYEEIQKRWNKRVFKYSSADANTENKAIIRRNFDAWYDKPENSFDVLIATDAISEWFNLHRAGTIINYDIPFNPTRVIQRIGRINRINKKVFDELYIYNFFPTSTGEVETRTRAISTIKMHLIHALLWEDTKILTGDEELKNYFAQSYRDAESESEVVSWDASHRKIWGLLKHDEDLRNKINEIPHRTRVARKNDTKTGVIAFGKRGSSHIFAFGNNDESIEYISPEEALWLFRAGEQEKSLETTANFDPVYQKVKAHLFKENTKATIKGRRQEAEARLDILSELYAPAKDYCDDIRKIIYELDALPEWVLKELSMLKINKVSPEETFKAVKELVPQEYIEKIFSKWANNTQNEQFILLTEQFLW